MPWAEAPTHSTLSGWRRVVAEGKLTLVVFPSVRYGSWRVFWEAAEMYAKGA